MPHTPFQSFLGRRLLPTMCEGWYWCLFPSRGPRPDCGGIQASCHRQRPRQELPGSSSGSFEIVSNSLRRWPLGGRGDLKSSSQIQSSLVIQLGRVTSGQQYPGVLSCLAAGSTDGAPPMVLHPKSRLLICHMAEGCHPSQPWRI